MHSKVNCTLLDKTHLGVVSKVYPAFTVQNEVHKHVQLIDIVINFFFANSIRQFLRASSVVLVADSADWPERGKPQRLDVDVLVPCPSSPPSP